VNDRTKAYTYALTVVFFWATIASAFKLSLRFLTIVELLFYSSVVSAAVLFIIITAQKKLRLLAEFRLNDYLFSVLLGFINPFFYYLVLFKAYSLLPAQQAQPLNMTWGIILALLSVPFLKQKLKWMDFFSLLVCFCGVIVISTEGNLSRLKITNPLGVLLALCTSVIWSFYWILNVKDKKDPLPRLFLNFCAGSIFILPLFLFKARVPPLEGLLGGIYVGLFEMGLSFFLWITALKLARSAVSIAILIYIAPFLSFIFIHFLLGEKILLSSILGAVLIVIGIMINKYTELKPKK